MQFFIGRYDVWFLFFYPVVFVFLTFHMVSLSLFPLYNTDTLEGCHLFRTCVCVRASRSMAAALCSLALREELYKHLTYT